MKKTLLITVALLIFTFSAYGQEVLSVTPSYYFSYGDYSNGTLARAHSLYTTVNLGNSIFPTIGYENQLLNRNVTDLATGLDSSWKYRQQNFVGGLLFSDYPNYVKVYYAHLKGVMTDKWNPSYSDYTNIYTIDYSDYNEGLSLGVSTTYLNAIGNLNANLLHHQQTIQGTARIEYTVSDNVFLSVKPSYFYSMIDKRKLWSASIKAQYLLDERMLLKAGGIVGKRAYYFDSDLLTVFNQDDTQKQCAFVSTEVFPGDGFTLTAAFLYSEFTDYHINYYVVGVRRFF